MNSINKKELLDLYISVIEEATDFFMSDYCNSKEEEIKRKQEDKEAIEYFKAILYGKVIE